MATFTFYDAWKGVSGASANLSSDTLKLSLCSAVPATSAVAASALKTNATEISAAGGYTAKTPTVTWTGTSTMTLGLTADQVWTASGAAFDQFRYVLLWDDTVTSPNADPCIGYWDYGSNVTLNDGESFTLDLNGSFAAYTLT